MNIDADALGRPVVRVSLKDEPRVLGSGYFGVFALSLSTKHGQIVVQGAETEVRDLLASLMSEFADARARVARYCDHSACFGAEGWDGCLVGDDAP